MHDIIIERWQLLEETISKADDEHLNMFDWHIFGTCGTAHCIAGWADVLSDPTREVSNRGARNRAIRWLLGCPQDGMSDLDLEFISPDVCSYEQLEAFCRLFHISSWPPELANQYYKISPRLSGKKMKAEVMVTVMRWWKKVLWDPFMKDPSPGMIYSLIGNYYDYKEKEDSDE